MDALGIQGFMEGGHPRLEVVGEIEEGFLASLGMTACLLAGIDLDHVLQLLLGTGGVVEILPRSLAACWHKTPTRWSG
jgi:hypothetical protein